MADESPRAAGAGGREVVIMSGFVWWMIAGAAVGAVVMLTIGRHMIEQWDRDDADRAFRAWAAMVYAHRHCVRRPYRIPWRREPA